MLRAASARVDEGPFNGGQCQTLSTIIDTYIQEVDTYVQLPADLRDARHLPVLQSNLSSLIADFHLVQLRLPAREAMQLKVKLRNGLDTLQAVADSHNNMQSDDHKPLWEDGPLGARRRVVDVGLIRTMATEGINDRTIADFFGVSTRTVLRIRHRENIHKRDWSTLTREDLKSCINHILHHGSGHEGEIGIMAGLAVLGFRVQRTDVRDVLRVLDRDRIAPANRILRRVYSVPWINSLWHIDGHHKINPWGIVIHGGIDGFSRTAVFLVASNNNRAETMHTAFMQGVQEYGWPSRVRGDKGQENRDVRIAMEQTRGHSQNSFIAGPSTRNQRIERLWVDVQAWCITKFRRLFISMEQEEDDLLVPGNEIHLWALHFAFLPMINQQLRFFQERYNAHKISTEGNRSPRQIWLENRMELCKLGIDPLQDPTMDAESQSELDMPATAEEWETYGEHGRSSDHRQPSQSHDPSEIVMETEDPYVEISPPLDTAEEGVMAYLHSDELASELNRAAGPYFPMPEDHGRERYRVIRDLLAFKLQERYPDLIRH